MTAVLDHVRQNSLIKIVRNFLVYCFAIEELPKFLLQCSLRNILVATKGIRLAS